MRYVRTVLMTATLLGGFCVLPACETDQAGVKSNYYSQWTRVNASTAEATQAAEAVLEELELRSVSANSTAVDGRAVGQTADGTEVAVGVRRIDDATSEVSVQVGALGDPDLGTDVLARLQRRLAED